MLTLTSKELQERYTRIGAGAEGIVFRLDKNLVAKYWYNPLFSYEMTEQSIKQRYLDIEEINAMIPDHENLVTPIFAGYETVQDELGNRRVITYHEYIQNDDDTELYNTLAETINRWYVDAYLGTNTKTMQGKVYLIDVAPSYHAIREKENRTRK